MAAPVSAPFTMSCPVKIDLVAPKAPPTTAPVPAAPKIAEVVNPAWAAIPALIAAELVAPLASAEKNA